MTPRELRLYCTADGACPFERWLAGLRDQTARARIRARLDRLSLGNAGDRVALGGGLSELRLHFGPGYRLYYAVIKHDKLLLLWGGNKRTQARDIPRAKAFLHDFRQRDHGNE